MSTYSTLFCTHPPLKTNSMSIKCARSGGSRFGSIRVTVWWKPFLPFQLVEISLKRDLSHSAPWRQTPEANREELWFICKTVIINGRDLNYCWNFLKGCSVLAGLSMKSMSAAKARNLQNSFAFTCLFNLPCIVYLMFFKGRKTLEEPRLATYEFTFVLFKKVLCDLPKIIVRKTSE